MGKFGRGLGQFRGQLRGKLSQRKCTFEYLLVSATSIVPKVWRLKIQFMVDGLEKKKKFRKKRKEKMRKKYPFFSTELSTLPPPKFNSRFQIFNDNFFSN